MKDANVCTTILCNHFIFFRMSTTGTNAQGYISVPIPGTYNLPNVSQPHFVEATVPTSQQIFPVRTFKVFGGIQIGLGILVGILSTISVVLDAVDMNNYDDCITNFNYVYYYDSYMYWGCRGLRNSHSLFAFDVTCLICSGWVRYQHIYWVNNKHSFLY